MDLSSTHPKSERVCANIQAEVVLVVLLLVIFAVTRHPSHDNGGPTQFYPLNLLQTNTNSLVNQSGRLLPDAQLTPGEVLTTIIKTFCAPGYARTLGSVPQTLKQQVLAEYGMLSQQPGAYKVGHLIGLGQGGSNSLRNLWPEPYSSTPLNAHLKDALDSKLHKLVC